jgi:hypothetical protein
VSSGICLFEAADVDADLVLWAEKTSVLTPALVKVVLIHLLTLLYSHELDRKVSDDLQEADRCPASESAHLTHSSKHLTIHKLGSGI